MTSIDALRLELNKALNELEQLRGWRQAEEEEAADMARQAADPHPVPMVVFGITQMGHNLRVDLTAASEMAFELEMSPDLDYEQVIAAICHVAPAMLRYDMAMMEAADDGGRTKIPIVAAEPTKDFVKRYKEHLVNISVELPPFARVKRR